MFGRLRGIGASLLNAVSNEMGERLPFRAEALPGTSPHTLTPALKCKLVFPEHYAVVREGHVVFTK